MAIKTEAEHAKVYIGFKLKAKVVAKQGASLTRRPALFDAVGKPMNEVFGDGSILKLTFEPVLLYTATVGGRITLRLKAVQVLA